MTTTSKTKRANGSGSLRWVESRQQYEHRVTIGRTHDEKPLSASFYGKTQTVGSGLTLSHRVSH